MKRWFVRCFFATIVGLATVLPAAATTVELHTVPIARGGRSVAIAVLRSEDLDVGHALVDALLPEGLRVAVTDLGRPDCLALCNHDYLAPWWEEQVILTRPPHRTKRCYFGIAMAFRPPGCDPGEGCRGIYLLDMDLGRGDLIPDGADLLQCTIEADRRVRPGIYDASCAAQVADPLASESHEVECVAAPVQVMCEGDCDGDGIVTVNELLRGVNIALEEAAPASCAAADRYRDGAVSIDELVVARSNVLFGCHAEVPTPKPTLSPTPGPIRFEPAQRYRTGPYPTALVLADLDRDGWLDAVVPLQPDYGVRDVKFFPIAVLHGRPDGSFDAPVSYTAGNTPESVVAADFNADGLLDLAAGNYNDPYSVSVLLGKPDGVFAPQQQYPCAKRPWALVAADFDADGAQDLVTANVGAGTRTLSLFRGHGDGGFDGEQRVSTCGTSDLAVGDVTGDGAIDLVAVGSGGVCVLRNARGVLQAPAMVDRMAGRDVALGRLDDDTSLDIAVVDPSGALRLFVNSGDGAFSALATYHIDGEPRDVAIADLDADGKADVITANYASRDVAVLVGVGNGRFHPPYRVSVGQFSLPHEVAVGDLNHDGRGDIVTINANTHDVSVLLGRR